MSDFKVGDKVFVVETNIGEMSGNTGIIKEENPNNDLKFPYLVDINGFLLYAKVAPIKEPSSNVRDYNVGDSDYAKHKIQPWSIWEEYNLNPWDADIIKRVLRNKKSQSRKLDYEKIIHVCKERIRQIDEASVDKE